MSTLDLSYRFKLGIRRAAAILISHLSLRILEAQRRTNLFVNALKYPKKDAASASRRLSHFMRPYTSARAMLPACPLLT
jgi:hypothetical protein